MPIEEISDYPEKMTEFELHWASVNTELGGTPETDFKLNGGYTIAQFSDDKDELIEVLDDLIALENELSFARSDRDDARTALRDRLMLFRDNVKVRLPNTRYVRSLPNTPHEKADQDELLSAIVDMKDIWDEINDDPPAEVAPALVLRGGYTLANLESDLATLRQRFDGVKAALQTQRNRRDDRDELLAAAYERMIQYRARLPLVLEPTNPLLNSMPKLRPSENGGGGGGVPAVPAAPTLEAVPGGQVVANWPDVSGATAYRLFKQLVGTDLDFVDMGLNIISQTTFTSLPPAELFRVKVAAVNTAGESAAGPYAEVETIA